MVNSPGAVSMIFSWEEPGLTVTKYFMFLL